MQITLFIAKKYTVAAVHNLSLQALAILIGNVWKLCEAISPLFPNIRLFALLFSAFEWLYIDT